MLRRETSLSVCVQSDELPDLEVDCHLPKGKAHCCWHSFLMLSTSCPQSANLCQGLLCAQSDELPDLEAGSHLPKGKAYRVLHPIPVKLTWSEVSYSVIQAKAGGAGEQQKRKVVVHPCSGAFMPREAIAIMGPSGAGESVT